MNEELTPMNDIRQMIDEQIKEQQGQENSATEQSEMPNMPIVQEDSATASKLQRVCEESSFTKALDNAKVDIAKKAYVEDEKYRNQLIGKVKEASIKSVETEKERQSLEKQYVKFHQERLETQQKRNTNEQVIDAWEKRQKGRQYHYDGVKPIMEFVGIKEPMNLILLYILTIILTPLYLAAKLWKGTVGAIISGADDSDRPKAVRGFLWTMIGAVTLGVIALGTYLILRYFHLFGL